MSALRGKEKALDVEWTLDMVNDLGNLYHKQGKLTLAEQMYERALRGYETGDGISKKRSVYLLLEIKGTTRAVLIVTGIIGKDKDF